MSELSKQYHSIIIGERNTWDDWHMVPTSRPVINPPEVATSFVEIPGADGALDYTEALAGRPVYKNRTGSWEFMVLNGYQEWYMLFNQLLEYLHGHTFSIVLEDEPMYQYEGRLTLNEWRSEERNSVVVIDYVLNPFKKVVAGAMTDWLWDDLTFNNDSYIIYYGSFDVDGDKERTIYNPTDQIVHPTITTTENMTVSVSQDTYYFPKGITEDCPIDLFPGANEMVFHGTGKVTINYDRGDTI